MNLTFVQTHIKYFPQQSPLTPDVQLLTSHQHAAAATLTLLPHSYNQTDIFLLKVWHPFTT